MKFIIYMNENTPNNMDMTLDKAKRRKLKTAGARNVLSKNVPLFRVCIKAS